MTLRELFERAYRMVGMMELGQDITEDNFLDDALAEFILLADSWSIQRLTIPAHTDQEFQVEPGKRIYTFGPNGDWVSARPESVSAAELYRDGVHYPLETIDLRTYTSGGFASRTISSAIPDYLYWEPTFPEMTVKFDIVPSDHYIIKLKSLIPVLDLANLVCDPAGCCNACIKSEDCGVEEGGCEGVPRYRVKGAWPNHPGVAEAAIAKAKTEPVPEDDECNHCCDSIEWTYNIQDLGVITGGSCDDYCVPQTFNGTITVERYYDKSSTFPKPLSLVDDIHLPPGFSTALRSNLAVKLAISKGRVPNQVVVAEAQARLRDLKDHHSRPIVSRVDKALQPRGGGYMSTFFGR